MKGHGYRKNEDREIGYFDRKGYWKNAGWTDAEGGLLWTVFEVDDTLGGYEAFQVDDTLGGYEDFEVKA